MTRSKVVLVGVLLAANFASPVLAADEACVQNNRIMSTKVLDSNTVLITDKQKKQYTVHMRGVCVGLDQNAENLTFRPQLELGCLRSGDSIGYDLPGERSRITVHGQTQSTCFVDSVTGGAPPANPG